MKFSWKIFISTFLTVLLALCLGGTLLISITFKKSIDSEVEGIRKDNQTIRIEIATLMSNYNKSMYKSEEDALEAVLSILSNNWIAENKQFRIRDEEGNVLSENLVYTEFFTMKELEDHSENILSYSIVQKDNAYYLQAKTHMHILNQKLIVENFNNVTPAFVTRTEQINFFFWVVIIVGSICAILNSFFTILITKPVYELIKVTKEIAGGKLNIRVNITSNDELGMLGKHFNCMADSLEGKVKELEDIAQRQEDFVGSFAHEIKTPLTSVIGYADLLRSKKLDEKTSFEAANYIFSEGKRLESLSIKLLELLVERNHELEYRNVPLRKIIKEVLEILNPLLQQKSIAIVLDIKDVIITVDEDLMKTVLTNIIDNARKAVDIGGKIVIKSEINELEIILSIIDNGKGMAKEELSKIAEPFYMVDKSRSRQEGGAGLGLTICTQIMKMHQGKITYASVLGEGTSIILTLRRNYDEN